MTTTNLLFGILFVLLGTAVFFIIRVEIRLRKLFRGSHAHSLESLIADLAKHADTLTDRADIQDERLTALAEKLKKQGRAMKLTRFNPFADVGGTQSFAVAIVNEEGDGVVFSSLYSRDRMSVFAKPVRQGASDVELTPEEAGVIRDAHNDLKQ